jgi:hypothetical protein
MARLRVHNFTISLDGYAGGPDRRPEEPLGDGGRRLHEWISCTVQCQTHMSPGRPAPTAGAAAERTDRVQRPPGPGPPRGF